MFIFSSGADSYWIPRCTKKPASAQFPASGADHWSWDPPRAKWMGSTPLFGLQPVLLSSNLASVVRKSTQATVSRAVQCWGVGQRDRPELICCQQTSHATPLGYMVNWGECIVLEHWVHGTTPAIACSARSSVAQWQPTNLPPTILNHSLGNWKPPPFSPSNTKQASFSDPRIVGSFKCCKLCFGSVH